MDAFTPTRNARGQGILFLVSGGFMSNPQTLTFLTPLLQTLAERSGYTYFAVLHGSQPDFVVSEIVPQIARAVRFVRYNAHRFGVDPNRLGIMGFSSGGHLSLMRGVEGDDGIAASSDPVERTSSRVQAVVAFFPPTDFLNYGSPGRLDVGSGTMNAFRQAFVHNGQMPHNEHALGRSISPIYQVTPAAAPTMLIHGDQDNLVPLQQSEIFLAAMRKAGVPCDLRIKKGAGHGWTDLEPDLRAAMGWFNRYLAAAPSPAHPAPAPAK
jgi:acetyl esterase/lipase